MVRRKLLSPRTCYLLATGLGVISICALSVADSGESDGWTNVTPTSMYGGRTRGAAWADYDKDGDLDLYLSQWAQPNKLLRNDGNDSFTNVTTEALTPPGEYYSGRVIWADFDNDGDLDLYICQSRDSHLLRNDGLDGFTNITNGEPLLNNGKTTRAAAWGDYDQDGFVDLYISTNGWSDHNRLLRNLGDGTFEQMSDVGPVENDAIGRGTSFVDYDNDGDLDIYLTNGDSVDGTPHLVEKRTNAMYRNDGGIFTDVTTPPLDATTHGRGAAWGDYDNDGDLDLYLANVFVRTGACCYGQEYTCLLTSKYACDNFYFGEYSGDGSSCEEVNCEPFSACCLPSPDGDGEYCQMLSILECARIGGTFVEPWTNCSMADCPECDTCGACCLSDDSCVELIETECLAIGGVFEGPGTSCIGSSCENSGITGACCSSTDNCTETTEEICTSIGGVYRGDLSTCDTVTCTSPLRGTEAPRAPKPRKMTEDLLDPPIDGNALRGDPFAGYDGENQLLRNDGNGVFTDVSIGDDLGYTGHTRCAGWADFDNDMDLDLLLVNAFYNLRLLRNDGLDSNGDPVFVNVATEPFFLGFVNTMSASWADYDQDGDMDVIVCVSQYQGVEGDNRLIRNDLNNGNNWLEIECVGTVSNRSAIGARLTATAGGVQQIREIESGSGYFAANMLPAHFGLGPNKTVDTLHVRFPNGREVTLTDVPANQKITVIEPCDIALGECDDCDLNGIPDIQDIADGTATDCNFNGVLDTCDLALGTSIDCNLNGIPDACDVAIPTQDCNANGIPDSCESLDPPSDCNTNGTSDLCDVTYGTSLDADGNGVPDECQISPCLADLDNSGTVDIGDFSIFLVQWGCTSECTADLNLDNEVNIADFSLFLILFGDTCDQEPFRMAPGEPVRNSRSGQARTRR